MSSTTTGSRRGAAPQPVSGGGAGRVMALLIVILAVGAAVVWTMAAQRQLAASIARESAVHLDRARRAFDLTRARTLDGLRGLARVMVEDPRLKSTLATEGVDEVTVADILTDLGKLRGSGFLMVLSLDGRVFAQAGADELRGLDLSGSSAVKKAQGAPEAVTGSWVIGNKIMDLSITPVRFGPKPIAYLVVGQGVDQDLLNAVAEQSGVAVATAAGQTVMLAAPPDERTKALFETVAWQLETAKSQQFEINGEIYVAAMSELEESGQARPRVVVAQSLAQASAAFATTRSLLYAPPVLVIIAVLFALAFGRRVILVRQSQEHNR